MENQTKRELEQRILLNLRNTAKTVAECEWLEARLARLDAPAPVSGNNRNLIISLADAVGFLAESCDLIAVQLEIYPPLWKVVSIDGEFEAVFSDTELIEFARQRQGITNNGTAEKPVGHDQITRSIDDTQAAKKFLRVLGVEIIETDGGIILRGVGYDADNFELSCDSEAELVEYARMVRDSYPGASQQFDAGILQGVGELNNYVELSCDRNADLIDHARYERDSYHKLCRELGVKSLKEVPKADATADVASPSGTATRKFPSWEAKIKGGKP